MTTGRINQVTNSFLIGAGKSQPVTPTFNSIAKEMITWLVADFLCFSLAVNSSEFASKEKMVSMQNNQYSRKIDEISNILS